MKKTLIVLLLSILSTGAGELYSIEFNPLKNVSELIQPDMRRGRGFGGRRSTRRSTPRRSTNKSKSNQTRSRSRAAAKPQSKRAPSFGGKRMTKSQATQRYGTPRRTQKVNAKNSQGVSQPYVVNHYGGYSSGLMMGYMMGSSMWYWSMPFHPAYYYSRPTYVENSDGSVEVYPPTFSWGRVFFTLILIGAIIFVIRRLFFKRNNSGQDYNSSGSFG